LEANAALYRKMHPVQSLLPWSPANQMAARAWRVREREELALLPAIRGGHAMFASSWAMARSGSDGSKDCSVMSRIMQAYPLSYAVWRRQGNGRKGAGIASRRAHSTVV
jgi:hypothetical protein